MENSAQETTRIPPVFTASEAKKEGYEEELGHPFLEEDLDTDGGCPHHHHKHHHGRRGYKNPFKFAFFILLGVNIVGVMKHCQMMRRKMEWCKAHPKKCEKWKKHHGMHGGKMEEKRGGKFLRNPIVDYFWPQPPMWMRHHAHDDEDWETTVKFEGETFPPEELGSENIGLEKFRVPENWKCKKHRKRARGRKDDDDDHDHDDDDDHHKYRGGKN
ncbi:unnamed protein product [Bathycoccus prasinos]